MNILVIDDDELVIDLLVSALAEVGYQDVETFIDPVAAAAHLKCNPGIFDAILLDIQMPGFDGIELCRLIRAIPEYRLTPIIMITAKSDRKYVNEAFRAGANDYLNKPFDPFEIKVRLRRIIDRRNASNFGENNSDLHAESIDGTVDRLLLENYLSQLSSCQAETFVVAIEISDIRSIIDVIGTGGLRLLFAEKARQISNLLSDKYYLLSYLGNGIFICACQTSGNQFDEYFRLTLQDMLDRLPLLRDQSISSAISISEPVRCRRYRKVDPVAVIDAAVTSLSSSSPRQQVATSLYDATSYGR